MGFVATTIIKHRLGSSFNAYSYQSQCSALMLNALTHNTMLLRRRRVFDGAPPDPFDSRSTNTVACHLARFSTRLRSLGWGCPRWQGYPAELGGDFRLQGARVAHLGYSFTFHKGKLTSHRRASVRPVVGNGSTSRTPSDVFTNGNSPGI